MRSTLLVAPSCICCARSVARMPEMRKFASYLCIRDASTLRHPAWDLYPCSVSGRDVLPVDAAAVGALFIPDAGIVAVSVSPDCSVVAVQHDDRIVCYGLGPLVDQRHTEPLWTWQLPGAKVRQARPAVHCRLCQLLCDPVSGINPTTIVSVSVKFLIALHA